MIYHITARMAWNQARVRGDYRAESLDSEGFIHCSTGEQVVPVAENFFKGQEGLLLLVIEPGRLTSDLKWEPPVGGIPPPGVPEDDLFPHVYGPINLEAVVRVVDLQSQRTESIFSLKFNSSPVKGPYRIQAQKRFSYGARQPVTAYPPPSHGQKTTST